MGWIRKFLMLFGRQYVMVRYSEQLTFAIRHAYPIAGRWYVRSTTHSRGHWILTNQNRVTSLEHFDPAVMTSSFQLWMPITDRCDAGVHMYE